MGIGQRAACFQSEGSIIGLRSIEINRTPQAPLSNSFKIHYLWSDFENFFIHCSPGQKEGGLMKKKIL